MFETVIFTLCCVVEGGGVMLLPGSDVKEVKGDIPSGHLVMVITSRS